MTKEKSLKKERKKNEKEKEETKKNKRCYKKVKTSSYIDIFKSRSHQWQAQNGSIDGKMILLQNAGGSIRLGKTTFEILEFLPGIKHWLLLKIWRIATTW